MLYPRFCSLIILSAALSTQAAWPFASKDAAIVTADHADDIAPVMDVKFETAVPPEPIRPGIAPTFSTPSVSGPVYRIGPVTFRPKDFIIEGAMTVLVLAYLLISLLARRANIARAASWFRANENAFRSEFAAVGFSNGQVLFESEGGQEFKAYASGRRGTSGLWATVKTNTWHDPLTKLVNVARGWADLSSNSGENLITLEFKLTAPKGTPGAKFCFSICDRKSLRAVRDSHWSLNKLTTAQDSTPGLNPNLISMSESGEITNSLLKEKTISNALQENSPGIEFFDNFIISDLPSFWPAEETVAFPEDEFYLTMTLRLPPAARSAETIPLIQLGCNIVDIIHSKPNLVPNLQLAKLRIRRSELLKEVQAKANAAKLQEAKEKREIELAAKKKLEKELQQAKLAELSQAERIKQQQKIQAKEKKQEAMKMAKKAKGNQK